MLFQNRDQRVVISPVAADITVDNEIVLYCDLDIVCRFQLAVEHVVFFHSHEGCFQICLGIAVPSFAHDLKVFLVFHQAAAAGLQFFIQLLDLRLTLSLSVNKTDPFPFSDRFQVFLQLQDLKRGTAVDFDHGIIGNLLVLCQLPFPVLLDHTPDFVHAFHHKHPGIPKIVFRSIPVFMQKCIVSCIKGINGVQKPRKMVV